MIAYEWDEEQGRHLDLQISRLGQRLYGLGLIMSSEISGNKLRTS